MMGNHRQSGEQEDHNPLPAEDLMSFGVAHVEGFDWIVWSPLNPSPLLSPVYPCSFEKRGIFSFFRDHLRSRCCRILLFFSRLEPLLFDTNSDHSFTYQGCFWAISGDLASITGGQTRNRGTDPNDRESSNNRSSPLLSARAPAAHAAARLSRQRVPSGERVFSLKGDHL